MLRNPWSMHCEGIQHFQEIAAPMIKLQLTQAAKGLGHKLASAPAILYV